MNYLKKFESFINESAEADPLVKPKIKPKIKPNKVKPRKPSPIRRKNPSIVPKPKAKIEEIINKFLNVASKKDKKEIIRQYED